MPPPPPLSVQGSTSAFTPYGGYSPSQFQSSMSSQTAMSHYDYHTNAPPFARVRPQPFQTEQRGEIFPTAATTTNPPASHNCLKCFPSQLLKAVVDLHHLLAPKGEGLHYQHQTASQFVQLFNRCCKVNQRGIPITLFDPYTFPTSQQIPTHSSSPLPPRTQMGPVVSSSSKNEVITDKLQSRPKSGYDHQIVNNSTTMTDGSTVLSNLLAMETNAGEPPVAHVNDVIKFRDRKDSEQSSDKPIDLTDSVIV